MSRPDDSLPSMIRLERGTLRELKRLLHAALWSDFLYREPFYLEDELVNEGDWTWKFNIVGFNAKLVASGMSAALRANVATDDSSFVLHPRLHRLAELIFLHFGVTCDDEALKNQVATHGYGIRHDLTYYCIPVPTPTAHEQIEAKFQVCDFLRGKVSPTELRELMGQ